MTGVPATRGAGKRSIEQMIDRLSPQEQAEVIDFIQFLLSKNAEIPRRRITCDWAGGLEDLRGEYTSVGLQHKSNEWRAEDEISR
ncbi:MAG: DUF2281 domain-containing protein [Syntrophobacteraceae bacterium]